MEKKIVVVKKFNVEKNRYSHYAYVDLGYRRLLLPFGDSPLAVNAELLGISVTEYLALDDGCYALEGCSYVKI